MRNALVNSRQLATSMAEGGVVSEEFVAKRGSNPIMGLSTDQLCLSWLGYHDSVGGVNAANWDNIIDDFISLDTCFAFWVTRGPASALKIYYVAYHHASTCGIRCDDPKRPSSESPAVAALAPTILFSTVATM